MPIRREIHAPAEWLSAAKGSAFRAFESGCLMRNMRIGTLGETLGDVLLLLKARQCRMTVHILVEQVAEG